MRILYVDCDSLRPDHLGCYGYHRDTSPNIDRIADRGRRFTNYYASDVPCLPSRTALFSSRFGIHTGVVNHGGTNAEMRPRGSRRAFNTQTDGFRSWPAVLRGADYQTAFVSQFPQRHGAYHTLDGFDEWIHPGGDGYANADVVASHADQWLDEHATDEDWYLHVNFWDPHTPYETPAEFGNPFADEPAPEWPDEETIQEQYESYGPHSAHEPHHWGHTVRHERSNLDRMPAEIDSREDFKEWVDGYDTGTRYMDEYIGGLLSILESAGVLDETLIILTADHGESLGEQNVYGDHQVADDKTCRVPLVVSGPGVEPGVDDGLHYNVDLPPTLAEFAGIERPPRWDGQSFVESLRDGRDDSREMLVLSQGAWACQRGVRFDDWLLIRTYHDGLKDFDPVELYDLGSDPHETTNLAREHPEIAREGIARLESWVSERLLETATDRNGGNRDGPRTLTDPLFEVISEGGPYHARPDEQLPAYTDWLRETGRAEHAEKLERTRGIVSQDVEAYLTGS
jgi:arylsulfatase A-like enzyme